MAVNTTACTIMMLLALIVCCSGEKWSEADTQDKENDTENWEETTSMKFPVITLNELREGPSSGTCAIWANGQKQAEVTKCSGARRCATTKMGDTTTSSCDTKDICTGMGTGMFKIADGECGLIPGSGQSLYCSATTPPGGEIPASVECKKIEIKSNPVPAATPTPTTNPDTPAKSTTNPETPSKLTTNGGGPAICTSYAAGSILKKEEKCATGNTLQCLTSEMGDLKTSNCDWSRMCEDMGQKGYVIADGECGVVDGQRLYCSSSTPAGGAIPKTANCQTIDTTQKTSGARSATTVLQNGSTCLTPQKGFGLAMAVAVLLALTVAS